MAGEMSAEDMVRAGQVILREMPHERRACIVACVASFVEQLSKEQKQELLRALAEEGVKC